MELLLKNRDYVRDASGGVIGLDGTEAVLARVLFQLGARRGSFPFLPTLGSRMYLLSGAKSGQWESLARQYAVEALADDTALAVTGVTVSRRDDRLWVEVTLDWKGETLTARLEV